jgi:hypothetical protein
MTRRRIYIEGLQLQAVIGKNPSMVNFFWLSLPFVMGVSQMVSKTDTNIIKTCFSQNGNFA